MQGIVCHYAKLPTDVKMYMERLMSNDSPKIIIATATLAQLQDIVSKVKF
jgi:replicative superfamily II helicase